jgi:hypothetical protein
MEQDVVEVSDTPLWFIKETVENFMPILVRETENKDIVVVESCFKNDIPTGSSIQVQPEQLISQERASYILNIHIARLENYMRGFRDKL